MKCFPKSLFTYNTPRCSFMTQHELMSFFEVGVEFHIKFGILNLYYYHYLTNILTSKSFHIVIDVY